MPQAKLRPGDPRDILVAKFEIENEDTFHLKNLYKLVYEWLADEGYVSVDDVSRDVPETLYCERIQASGAKEHYFWWRTVHVPQGNRYYRYYLKIDWQTLRSKPVEIMEHGHKMKTDKSDLIIRVEGWLQLDYRNEWRNHWLLKHVDKLFRERINHDQVLAYRNDLYNAVYRLQQTIKQYLKLKTPAERPRMFHPEGGV